MYNYEVPSKTHKSTKEFEFSPQEEVANYMFGTKREHATASDIDFCIGKLPNWQIRHTPNDGKNHAEFSRDVEWQHVDGQLLRVAHIICNNEGMRISADKEVIRLKTPRENIFGIELARLALVDFAVEPSRSGTERFETFSRIIGNVKNRSRVKTAIQTSSVLTRGTAEQTQHTTNDDAENRVEALNTISKLSKREKEVLANIHLSNDTISDNLNLSASTVRTHIHKIYKKLGTNNVRDLILLSFRSGISTLSEADMSEKNKVVFSRRESQVFDCLVNGLEYDKIAEHLFVSEATIRSHLHRIYGKLGADGKRHAILLALLGGIDIFPELPSRS